MRLDSLRELLGDAFIAIESSIRSRPTTRC